VKENLKFKTDPVGITRSFLWSPIELFYPKIASKNKEHTRKMVRIEQITLRALMRGMSFEEIGDITGINCKKWCHRQAILQAAKKVGRSTEALKYFARLEGKKHKNFPNF
jgi:hypothetical protein